MKLFEAAPPDLVLRTLLVQGGAFTAKYEFLDEGAKKRFFVVANLDPENADTIILFTSTTQITKRRKHHKERAGLVLVPLNPKTYDGVVEECVIDCESPIKRKQADFLRDVKGRQYAPVTSVPEDIMKMIIEAVKEARTLSLAEKRLILGNEPPLG